MNILHQKSLDQLKNIALKIGIACDLSNQSKRLRDNLLKTDKERLRNCQWNR